MLIVIVLLTYKVIKTFQFFSLFFVFLPLSKYRRIFKFIIGSLKIWNFNTGTCYRNMRIKKGCEVTNLIWIKGRILAIGWNRQVTEFNDTGVAIGPGGAFSKNWDKRHDEDVLSCAVRVPQTLVTATFNGELILWQLETGQAYKRYTF